MHPEATGLVGGGGDHTTPIGRPAHDDRLATIFGVVTLLDAGIEGVQVEMEDGSCCLVHAAGCSSAQLSHLFSCASIVPASAMIGQAIGDTQCSGAGRPTLLPLPNLLLISWIARGRQGGTKKLYVTLAGVRALFIYSSRLCPLFLSFQAICRVDYRRHKR